MPVGEFTAIVMISPAGGHAAGRHRARKTVSPLRWTLVVWRFCGTLIIIRPGGEVFGWALLLPLGLVATNAWFQVLTSRLVATEDPFTMHFYTGWVGAAGLRWPAFRLDHAPPCCDYWAGLLLMGVMGTVGHFMLILAYSARRPPRSRPTSTRRSPLPCSAAGWFFACARWLAWPALP